MSKELRLGLNINQAPAELKALAIAYDRAWVKVEKLDDKQRAARIDRIQAAKELEIARKALDVALASWDPVQDQASQPASPAKPSEV
jgi:hypothetical protein